MTNDTNINTMTTDTSLLTADLMTRKELMQELHLGKVAFLRMVRAGELPYTKINGKYVFSRKMIHERLLEQMQASTATQG